MSDEMHTYRVTVEESYFWEPTYEVEAASVEVADGTARFVDTDGGVVEYFGSGVKRVTRQGVLDDH